MKWPFLAWALFPNSGSGLAEPWRLLTYSLLHLNSAHLLLNVAILLWAGSIVERRAGASGFALS